MSGSYQLTHPAAGATPGLQPPCRRGPARPVRAALLLVALAALGTSVASAAPGGPARPPAPSCTSHRTEARYVNYGYDHWVFVKNACQAAVRCRVSTDVAPSPVEVGVPPGKTAEVLTFRGSPAREFRATVSCEYR